jgi:hypothetical protein
VADYYEYDDHGGALLPGEALVLRLCKYWECKPWELVGRNIAQLERLMRIDSVMEVAQAAKGGLASNKMTPQQALLHRALEAMRDADDRFHGPLLPTEDPAGLNLLLGGEEEEVEGIL